ncbi:Eco57I restriction-modification methylase domain-containing protein [Woeseia oceani]|uniref:site-specific DNA-methyltransferase (adenine-specific) n=1 Tax=Woeseia oceani TaxID=1548547 RepID=A0A193LDC4_9GAMM|nr:N-6 DNA methylase [Woeseia oceani]ANO50441.1 hypothetical protein BA177_03760 [Woeseia oceani]
MVEANQALNRYGEVPDEKATGSTYTPASLARFVAEQIVAEAGSTLEKPVLRLLDPAVGDGALLIELLRQLKKVGSARLEVFGFDTDKNALAIAERNIRSELPDGASLELICANFLDLVLARAEQGDMFAEDCYGDFDLLIANPPYVRTQIMGADIAQRIAKQFQLSGRVDLYYAFLAGMKCFLNRGAIAGVIVSNRFMTIKSGTSVRKSIRENFCIRHVWDLGDTKLFDVAVLPAVLLLSNEQQSCSSSDAAFTSIYETKDEAEILVDNPVEGLSKNGVVEVSDSRRFRVQQGRLFTTEKSDGVWRIATEASDCWLETVQAHTWRKFRDIGKIRVGVKTTADKVFIRKDWTEEETEGAIEALRPLTTHLIANRFRPMQEVPTTQILYTHETVDGRRRAIALDDKPHTKAYLLKHRETLERRTYVRKAGRNWYEIWVPQKPADFEKPKIVFRDISQEPVFWLDRNGSIVNGDCYWLVSENGHEEEILWLVLGVANSTFAEEFYDHSFRNQLYAGRRRFITQYVQEFPLPDPASDSSKQIVEMAKAIYETTGMEDTSAQEVQLSQLVYQAFGLCMEEV